MRAGDGVSKINGVALGELVADFLQPATKLKATYALADVSTGERFGRGVKEGDWSPATVECLGKLIDLVEEDICRNLFIMDETEKKESTPSTESEDDIEPVEL
jgi:hypothetical protein